MDAQRSKRTEEEIVAEVCQRITVAHQQLNERLQACSQQQKELLTAIRKRAQDAHIASILSTIRNLDS